MAEADPGRLGPVGQRMDEVHLWAMVEEQGERQPLVTPSEAQAAVVLLRREGTDAADKLATRIARRLSAQE
ncbi:hypothetical protein GTZ78_48030 [Streptomyces sp. SID8361]|nr:hypothetical protein [Streptomyces sp. SID8361]